MPLCWLFRRSAVATNIIQEVFLKKLDFSQRWSSSNDMA